MSSEESFYTLIKKLRISEPTEETVQRTKDCLCSYNVEKENQNG